MAVIARTGVTLCLPDGDKPIRSTIMDEMVWPPTAQIVKMATPMIGTVLLWIATKNPPPIPPITSQGFNLRARKAFQIFASPFRSGFHKRQTRMTKSHPVRNEISAAAIPL